MSQSTPPDLGQLIDELQLIHDSGDVEEYARFTGEQLAAADSGWRRARELGEDTTPWLAVVSMLAPAHISALSMQPGSEVDVFSAALTALVTLDFADSFALEVPGQCLVLTNLATSAFNTLTTAMPCDEFTMRHVPVIWRYLGSMLAFYYKLGMDEDPANPYLPDSRQMLDEMQSFGIVSDGTVDVNGETVEAAHPAHLWLDLIARAQALGIFRAD